MVGNHANRLYDIDVTLLSLALMVVHRARMAASQRPIGYRPCVPPRPRT